MASPDAPDDPALARSTIPLVKYTGEEYETRLSNARLGHARKLAEYNSGPELLPTMEEVAHALVVNPWLAAVVHKAAQMKKLGYTGTNMSPADFPHHEHLQALSYCQLADFVVPFVRRLGYQVTLYSVEENCLPFSVGFVGHQFDPAHATESRLKAYARGEHSDYLIHLHGTSPMQIRHRGLLKCVPRLLGWLRSARITLADPRRPGAMAALIQANEAGMAEDYPPHWASGAEVQRKRKREMVDAVHGEYENRASGVLWYKITEHGTFGPCRVFPVRVEAVAGEYFVFQRPYFSYDRFHVVALHRDAFQVHSWDRELHELWRNYSRKGAERHFVRWRDSCVGAPEWDPTNGEES